MEEAPLLKTILITHPVVGRDEVVVTAQSTRAVTLQPEFDPEVHRYRVEVRA